MCTFVCLAVQQLQPFSGGVAHLVGVQLTPFFGVPVASLAIARPISSSLVHAGVDHPL